MTVFELMSTLALHLSRHPLALTVGIAILLRIGMGPGAPATLRRALLRGYATAGVAGLLTYGVVVVFYAAGPQYFDAAEPTITAIGWLFQAGQPVYHELDAPDRYSHIYGPMVFIVHSAALSAFGASIQASKWVGSALAVGALALTFSVLQQKTGRGRALVLVGMAAVVLLGFRNYSFWTRPEPLQVFGVAAALATAHLRTRTLTILLSGLALGVLWNLKLTGPLYSLPLLAILTHRHGWRSAAATSVVAAVVAAFPFLIFPNVSFAAYLTWVGLSAQTGLDLSILRQNLEWTAYLIVPLVVTWYSTPRDASARWDGEWRAVILALGLATVGVIAAGSKPGAGPYHLLPFVPIVAYLVASRLGTAEMLIGRPDVAPVAAAFLVIGVSTAITQQYQFLQIMASRRAIDVAAEIVRVADAYGGVVEMGYALNDPITFQRPLLVFRNNSYLLDQPAVGEHLLAGIEIPSATIGALRQCRVNYWLLPKGEPPFAGVNMYPAVRFRPLFPASFRAAFLEGHRLVESTEHFDVWECRAPIGRAAR